MRTSLGVGHYLQQRNPRATRVANPVPNATDRGTQGQRIPDIRCQRFQHLCTPTHGSHRGRLPLEGKTQPTRTPATLIAALPGTTVKRSGATTTLDPFTTGVRLDRLQFGVGEDQPLRTGRFKIHLHPGCGALTFCIQHHALAELRVRDPLAQFEPSLLDD